MNNAEFGFLLLAFAGLMNASFTLPMKFTRRWAWENTWLVWTVFALLLLPAVATLSTVPGLAAVYRTAGIGQLLWVMTFGAGWGLAQVFFGLAVEAIGIALTFSLVLGTSAAVGALIPMLRLHQDKIHTPAGHIVLLGIATVLLGVAICAVAGRLRESATHSHAREQRGNSTAGLVLAIVCGCGASFVNFGLAFGAPLIGIAVQHGASSSNAINAVWLPLLAAGAIPNLAYCLYLLNRNSSGGNFMRSRFTHWALAFAMAAFWFGSTLLYGASVARLGPLGAVLGWPLFMSLIVIAASLLGIVTGEWRRSGRWPLSVQLAGVATLILAIFILASASQALA
ncbi:MAG: L-rhamnose/proton symporter RhaT [Terracidiphilus sp.]